MQKTRQKIRIWQIKARQREVKRIEGRLVDMGLDGVDDNTVYLAMRLEDISAHLYGLVILFVMAIGVLLCWIILFICQIQQLGGMV